MELYHVTNKGVEGREIFADTQDYARFVHDLYEFNDTAPALEYNHALSRANVGRRTSYIRERLVDIHAWVLMKNHFHLLLSERTDGGITLFLRKLSGYARYFNERHGRRGVLFQGKPKKVHVEQHRHFLYVPHYIHLNPLDYLPGARGWRQRDKGTIHNMSQVLSFVKDYRWSSCSDYMGKPNFPSVLTTSLFRESLGSDYESSLKEYLRDRSIVMPEEQLFEM